MTKLHRKPFKTKVSVPRTVVSDPPVNTYYPIHCQERLIFLKPSTSITLVALTKAELIDKRNMFDGKRNDHKKQFVNRERYRRQVKLLEITGDNATKRRFGKYTEPQTIVGSSPHAGEAYVI